MKNQTPDENEALKIIQDMQGTKKVTVPLVINGQRLHDGIEFNVSILEYNDFINESAGQKTSATASGKNFLLKTVNKDHLTILREALKVIGVLDQMLQTVIEHVAPDVDTTLD